MFDESPVGTLNVAKKRAAKKQASGPETWNRKPLIANFRGSPEFKGWLQRLATYDRQSVAGVIERATVHYARSIGFDEEAPER